MRSCHRDHWSVYLGRGSGPGEERVAVKVLRSSVDAHVMERLARGQRVIDGPTLQDRVEAQGPLLEPDLQRLAVGTATALTAIHGARVVHRDFNTLTLTASTVSVLTFSEPQTAACVVGMVTFTRHGADLAYRWTDNVERTSPPSAPANQHQLTSSS